MDIEKTFTNCENHRVANRCDPWVAKLNLPPLKPLSPFEVPQGDTLKMDDIKRADKICSNCQWFSQKII